MKNNAKWLFQSSGIRLNLEEETWFSQQVKFLDYGIIPFTNTITNLENIYADYLKNNSTHIIRGGTKILSVFLKDNIKDNIESLNRDFKSEDNYLSFFKRLNSGIFYDELKFDQRYYKDLGLPLLNKDSQVFKTNENKYLTFDEPMFIKPSSDGKAFVGGILFPGETVEQFILNKMHSSSIWDEWVLVAPEKKVKKEYRFFILNGEVITGSQYYENHSLKVRRLDSSDNDAISCAREYARLYQPAELFTLDICLEKDNSWSIVEYNCFNCSGFYLSNLNKIKEAVEGFLN